MKTYLPVIPLLIYMSSCQSGDLEEYRQALQSGDKNRICEASHYLGEVKDTASIALLLKDIYDARISHHLNYKGMSVYYCKASALKKITGINVNIQQHQPPDSTVINQFVDWAIEQKIVDANQLHVNRK